MRNADDIEHRLVHRIARLFKVFDEARVDVRQLDTGIIFVNVVGRTLEFVCGIVALGMQNAVLHFAIIDDQDGEHPVIREWQELDLPQGRARALRHSHYARQARNP